MPITYHEPEGEATLDSFRDGWRHVRFMLMNASGHLFTAPALALGGIGVLMMLLSLLNQTIGGIFFGWHTMIAGSLLTIVAYQIGSLAVFSSIVTDPIRRPRDAATERIRERFKLQHGATLGLVLFGAGTLHTAYPVAQWVQSGYTTLPLVPSNMLAFTAVVLGIQTVFTSFFLSMLGSQVTDR